MAIHILTYFVPPDTYHDEWEAQHGLQSLPQLFYLWPEMQIEFQMLLHQILASLNLYLLQWPNGNGLPKWHVFSYSLTCKVARHDNLNVCNIRVI